MDGKKNNFSDDNMLNSSIIRIRSSDEIRVCIVYSCIIYDHNSQFYSMDFDSIANMFSRDRFNNIYYDKYLSVGFNYNFDSDLKPTDLKVYVSQSQTVFMFYQQSLWSNFDSFRSNSKQK